MSNLGLYQILTTASKKVGGPLNLVAMIFGGGIVVGAGGNEIRNRAAKKKIAKKKEAKKSIVYKVNTEGKSNEGLLFKVGDTFKVLDVDGDAALIVKIGDSNNPYFVSAEFLKSISDYH